MLELRIKGKELGIPLLTQFSECLREGVSNGRHQEAAHNEMRVLEGNILTVRGQQCTREFQPSADQSWQSWAKNDLNHAETYPSPYANVHKGQLSKMGGTIGNDSNCTWQVHTQEKRQEDLGKLQAFQKTFPKDLNPTQGHRKNTRIYG